MDPADVRLASKPAAQQASFAARAPDLSAGLDVADAILYEGYLLYPYRRSSAKNRVPWQFGVLAPRSWIGSAPAADGVAGSAESWWNQTQCLVECPATAQVALCLRFLELDAAAGSGVAAVPRQVDATFAVQELCGEERVVDFGDPMVAGRLTAGVERLAVRLPLLRLTVRVENTAVDVPSDTARDDVLRRSMLSTHLLAGVQAGGFLSLLDPPDWAAPAARGCRNVRAFPVLAGPVGSDRIVLSAPIILYDHPRVAPESPGNLFDATEIDEILSLRTLTLTEEEKAEARLTDPRAAEIIDRVETMPPEVLGRLHGAVRSLRALRPSEEVGDPPDRSHQPGQPDEADQPDRADLPPASGLGDHIRVAGVPVAVGTKVRLRPRLRGTDAQDMFLAGRTATVAALLTDVDGGRFVAVSVDDDPRSTVTGGPGQLRHFTPDELEPFGAASETR